MARDTAERWIASAKDISSIDYYISIDDDDPEVEKYKAFPLWTPIVGKNKSAIEAINSAAQKVLSDMDEDTLIVVVSDDFDCPNNWDSWLRMHLSGKKDYIVKTLDGIQQWIITLPIMDKVYYNRFGYIYHPGYMHMFADTEMTCVADMTARRIDLLNMGYEFTHRHYTAGGMAKDAINEKNDATWNQGEKLFYQRMDANFDVPADRIVSLDFKHRFKRPQ